VKSESFELITERFQYKLDKKMIMYKQLIYQFN